MGSRRRRDRMGRKPSQRRQGLPAGLPTEGGTPPGAGQAGEAPREPSEPRMVCVTVPCPRCGRFVDAMALKGVWRQRVSLTSHNAPDGTGCSKHSMTLPRIPTERGGRYADGELLLETIAPAEKRHHPTAPEVEAPMVERLRMYAAACPFSTLVRLVMDASEASKALWHISGVVDPEAVDESDHFAGRIEDVEQALEEALAGRFRAGLERLNVDEIERVVSSRDVASGGFEVERTISFRDPASDEFVHMPLAALRVTPSASSYFEPGELPDEPDEDEELEDAD